MSALYQKVILHGAGLTLNKTLKPGVWVILGWVVAPPLNGKAM